MKKNRRDFIKATGAAGSGLTEVVSNDLSFKSNNSGGYSSGVQVTGTNDVELL